MILNKKIISTLAIAVSLAGCGGGPSDPAPEFDTESYNGPSVSPNFDVAEQDFPLPNDILFSLESAADGTMFAGTDPTNPVVTGIDYLDGASTLAHIDIKFDGSLDSNQDLDASPYEFVPPSTTPVPNRSQNVFLIPLRYPSGDALLNPGEVPTLAPAFDYSVAIAAAQADTPDLGPITAIAQSVGTPEARASIISLDGGVDNVLRITPLQPLQPRTKYLVVVTKDIVDSYGKGITESVFYNLFSGGMETDDAQIGAIISAVQGWEQLANGYFSFMDQVYAGVGLSTDTDRGIALSYTFTTGGVDSVLKSIAAPSTYFADQIETGARKAAIAKLVAGTYNFNADNTGLDATDIAINTTLNGYLTNSASPFYVADLAAAIGADVITEFADVSTDASLSYLTQLAAAEAGVAVEEGDGVSIALEAAGTATALSALLPTPESRASNFYREDCIGPAVTGIEALNCASPLSPLLTTVPAIVAQGEIDLPYYLVEPANVLDGTNIVTGTWAADATLAGAMSVTLPSDKITYRFPFPEEKAEHTVPVLAVYPNEGHPSISKPVDGWPVIIFQHGITADRGIILPMAGALAYACALDGAASCFATVAIDQPLHGVSPSGSFGLSSVEDPDVTISPNIALNEPSAGLMERHFNFTANASALPTPMDYSTNFGTSGTLFSNLFSFPTGGDNLRQAGVDLLNLIASLGDMDVDGDGNPDFDTDNVYFVGHSLGAINGVPFVAVNNDADVQGAALGNASLEQIKAISIFNSGGFITRLLENSQNASFGGPAILQGLAAQGITQDSSDFQTFMSILQGNLDSADSMNFARNIASGDATGVLITEIMGGATVSVPTVDDPGVNEDVTSLSDTTIPNDADADVWTVTEVGPLSLILDNGFVLEAEPTPLAGTEPLASQMGATKTADVTIDGTPVRAITRFNRGSHFNPVSAGTKVVGGEIFDRYSDQDVFLEMAVETVELFTSGGLSISVTDTDVVED